eukprot:XP_001689414.1 cysteine endopeptidase [Chlamydomonas reinhardtii]
MICVVFPRTLLSLCAGDQVLDYCADGLEAFYSCVSTALAQRGTGQENGDAGPSGASHDDPVLASVGQGTQRLYDSLASKAGASLGLFEAVCGGSGVFRPHVEVAVPQVDQRCAALRAEVQRVDKHIITADKLQGFQQAGAGAGVANAAGTSLAAVTALAELGNFRVPLSDMYNWLIIGNTQGSAILVNKMFDQFATAYGKQYTPTQALVARKAFETNLQTIASINLDAASTFTASCNAYCDTDFDTFQRQQLMDVGSLGDMPTGADDLPGSDGVGPGRLRQLLGLSNYLIRYGSGPACDSLDLSEQQLVSCANKDEGYGGSKGCSGGWSTDALDYVYKRKQMTERWWPYTQSTGTCNRGMPGPGERIATGRSFYLSTAASEDRLKRWVAIGPTVIYFCVEDSFRWYTGGYYSSNTCGTCHNHAMVAVGYTGTGWGGWEFGYIRVRMQGSTAGPCGLHQTAIAPTFQFTETLSSRCPPPPPKPPAPCRGIFCNIDIFRPGINIVDLLPSPSPPPPCTSILCKGLVTGVDITKILTPTPAPVVNINDKINQSLCTKIHLTNGTADVIVEPGFHFWWFTWYGT